MKEMVVAQKDQLQKRGKKGFTLMEMLIVVAIIAILVAIAIPTFMSSLNKARAEADVANCRSYYAEALSAYELDGTAPTAVPAGSSTISVGGTEQTLQGGTVTVDYTAPTKTTKGEFKVTYNCTNGATSLGTTEWTAQL